MSKRRKLDQYFTPEFATKTLLEHAAGGPVQDTTPGNPWAGWPKKRFDIRGTILEPCVGDGAISKVFLARNELMERPLSKFYSARPFDYASWTRYEAMTSGNDAIECKWSPLPGMRDTIVTNDIDPGMPADTHEDASLPSFWEGKRYDWIVSNPPFSCAAPIVQLAYAHADKGVAMLLRLSFLEPCKGRAEWLEEHPPTQLVVLPRISFTGDGKTDNVTCAWMIWDKTWSLDKGVHVVTKYTVGLKSA